MMPLLSMQFMVVHLVSQDLSVAGKRKGMQHADLGDEETTRSGLFMEQIRITKEMRENDKRNGRTGVDIRPRYDSRRKNEKDKKMCSILRVCLRIRDMPKRT